MTIKYKEESEITFASGCKGFFLSVATGFPIFCVFLLSQAPKTDSSHVGKADNRVIHRSGQYNRSNKLGWFYDCLHFGRQASSCPSNRKATQKPRSSASSVLHAREMDERVTCARKRIRYSLTKKTSLRNWSHHIDNDTEAVKECFIDATRKSQAKRLRKREGKRIPGALEELQSQTH